MVETRTFFGIPIEGSVEYSHPRKEQRSPEEFYGILLNALSAEGVKALRWHQYTPYFNDGDPCYFSAYMDDECAKLEGFEDWVSLGDEKIFGGEEREYRYDGDGRYRSFPTGVTHDKHPAADAVNELCAAINGSEFEDVLLDAFGDHAVVEARKDGITVEFYEHD